MPVLTKYPVRCQNEYHADAYFVSKYYGGNYQGAGSSLNAPLDTITTVDHNALVDCRLQNTAGEFIDGKGVFKKVEHHGKINVTVNKISPGQPLGNWPLVRNLLNKYCGFQLKDDEILLLEVAGQYWFIADILMRMLTPRELFNGQGFPSDYIIDHDEKGKQILLKKQISCAGNSVCPQLAEAFVRANFPEYCAEERKAA